MVEPLTARTLLLLFVQVCAAPSMTLTLRVLVPALLLWVMPPAPMVRVLALLPLLPMVTAPVAALVKVRLAMEVAVVRLFVVRNDAAGVVVLKNTFVVASGVAWVSTLLVASVRQLVTPPTLLVLQLPSRAPDQ